MVGGEDGGEENGEQPRDAEQHAVEQHAVLLLRLIGVRVPQIERRHLLRAELGGEGDGLPGLEAQAEHVGAIALERLGAEPERGGDGGDARGVEDRPEHARIGQRVARRDQPAHDPLRGRIGKSEDEPGGIGAGRRGRDRHAADIAVGTRRRLDLEPVAAPLIELALGGDVDLVLIGLDGDGFDGARKRRRKEKGCGGDGASNGADRADKALLRRRLTPCRGAQLHRSSPMPA